MSSVSIPKNSYMLWLKDNRENIKQMYFSNYTLKTDSNGKKENFQTILAKKAGEIWKSLGQEDKQSYANKLKELKELKESQESEEDEDLVVDFIEIDGVTYYKTDKGELYDPETVNV